MSNAIQGRVVAEIGIGKLIKTVVMKRYLPFTLSALMLFSCSDKYDDSDLWDSVNSLEERVVQLEELCKEMNTNISSLQTIVTALQNRDCITSVVPVMQNGEEIGYTITFAQSAPITIYHGADGEKGETGATGRDGHTPVIGVKQDADGIYYWTLDGEWLTDGDRKMEVQGADGANGKSAYELAVEKGYGGTLDEWLASLEGSNGASGNDGKSAYELAVEKGYSGTLDEWLEGLRGDTGPDGASGITPQLKIENGYWNVSYDNGNTWTQLGKATGEDGEPGGDSMFQRVDYETSDEYVIFTLNDGTSISVARYNGLSIAFAEGASLTFMTGETKTIHYTIQNADETGDVVVKAEMLNDDGGYTLRTIPTSRTQGTIEIAADVPTVNQVIVTVSDGSRTILSAIDVDGAMQTVTVATPGTLAGLLADYDLSTITELTIVGNLNAQDLYTLDGLSNLSVLDMEQVNLEEIPDNSLGFNYNKTLTVVKLPRTLKRIGKNAFYSTGLVEITIPESVTEIGVGAFERCDNLKSFHGKYASEDGSALIQDGVLLAFAPADRFEYAIPQGVTSIGEGVFYSNSRLMKVIIPEGVTTIGRRAFDSCISLTEIVIPESVTEIGERAFERCSNLKAFHGKYASEDNRALIQDGVLLAVAPAGLFEYAIPQGVTSIGKGVFYSNSRLMKVIIPEGVTTIGGGAFGSCISLTEIVIPDGVTTIGNEVFQGCSSLTEIVIPKGVTMIRDCTFRGCESLTDVTIPEGVTTICNVAFEGCSNLTKITIPEGVTTIGGGVFSGCISLTEIVIPDGVTTIGNNVFRGCSNLTKITIPEGVTTIYDELFYGCTSLTKLYCKPETPPQVGGSLDLPASCVLYVPKGRAEAYRSAPGWSSMAFAEIIEMEF